MMHFQDSLSSVDLIAMVRDSASPEAESVNVLPSGSSSTTSILALTIFVVALTNWRKT